MVEQNYVGALHPIWLNNADKRKLSHCLLSPLCMWREWQWCVLSHPTIWTALVLATQCHPHFCFSKLCLRDRILCWSIKKKKKKNPYYEAPGSQLPPPTLLFDLNEGLTEQKHCSSHEAPGGSCFTRAMKGTTVNNGGLFDPTFVCDETPASTLL